MYDARGSSSSGAGNLVFGGVTLVVVGLAFLLAWFGGDLFSGKSGDGLSSRAALPTDSALSEMMRSPEEKRFLTALNRLDASAYSRLEAEYTSAGNREDQLKTVGEAAGWVIMNNAEHLAHVSANDLNEMLDTALAEVGAARRANHALCKGSSYVGVENMSQPEMERWLARHGLSLETAYMSSVGWQADILEMIERAKRSPQRHGKINRQDEQAFQGLMMSMMSDPAIMQLAMTNGKDTAALRNVDVCAVGESLLREVRELPDGTKARAWATMFDMPEFRQGLSQVRNMGF
ncbi:MAG: hypothetical protein MRY64_03285 [Hyphomonadaceae bacterium]|nr:hypothetical protein [Hyphomonadaceae bacterium]